MQRKPSEAIANYELVLKRNARYTDVNVFMRLATLYFDRGMLQKAKVAQAHTRARTRARTHTHVRQANYIDACRLEPSSSTWLGLGLTCCKMDEFKEAEEALAEAHTHTHTQSRTHTHTHTHTHTGCVYRRRTS